MWLPGIWDNIFIGAEKNLARFLLTVRKRKCLSENKKEIKKKFNKFIYAKKIFKAKNI